jgi:DNA (cytosine-5)-methyltransferase 1
MPDKPVLLDLFCKAGGCTKGYQRAGFYVVGVDIDPQPNYCGDEFHRADALGILDSLLMHIERGEGATNPLWGRGPVVAVHASPPCQRHSAMSRIKDHHLDHPELVAPTRELLVELGLPYVIENVERAPLLDPVTICGAAYCDSIEEDGKRFYMKRHRLFECSFPMMVRPCACSRSRGEVLGIYGGGTRIAKRVNLNGGETWKANKAQAAALMGIDWMTRTEMCQAIPPAYTEAIGSYLMQAIELEAAVA